MPVRLRPAWLVNGLLGAALAGGGVWVYVSFVPVTASEAAAARTTRTVPVARGTVTKTVSASGAVRSASTASASFGTGGTVRTIAVKVGDKVAKGATLATVDDTAPRRQLAAAEDDLDAARDALDRAHDAHGDASAAQAQVDQAERDVDAAQDAVAGTVLKAPMAGTVTAVNGTLGGPASGGSSSGGSNSGGSGSGSSGSSGSGSGSSGSGSASARSGGAASGSGAAPDAGSGFVTIEDLGHLEVAASVAEADATKLRTGQAATVTWNALPGARSTATLTAVDPTATTSGDVVTYGATFKLGTLPDGVRAGQTVEVAVVVGSVKDAVTVLSAAVTGSGNRHTVTVDDHGQPATRAVEVGLEGDQTTEITSGLDVGEQVMVTIPTGGGAPTGNQPGGGRFPGGGGFPGGATGGGFRGGGFGGRQGGGGR